MTLELALPWPPKELSPNARIHYMAKAKATKIYRDDAYWRAYMLKDVHGRPDYAHSDHEITLKIAFHPPDKRPRDLDGMLSSIKAGLDGMADAMRVNDQRFAFEIHRREPVKNGKVVITIGEG